MLPIPCRTAIAAACVLGLAACAPSPIKRWDAPARADVHEATMDYALAYANKARTAYQQAIDEQVTATSQLGGGLIGAGALMAALAVSKAHRDALVALGLGSAAAYALGNWNYNKQRPLIYMAGIEGIGCAVRAVTPLYISEARLDELKRALVDIESAGRDVVSAIATLSNAGAALAADDPARKEMDAVIAEANARLEAARAISKSGTQFVNVASRAGAELVNAVNRIDDTVGKALLDTLPDLSAVPKIIGSLAGLAGSFAPTAAVSKTITDALAASSDAKAQARRVPRTGAPARSPAFIGALQELTDRSDRLAEKTAAAQARLAGYDLTAGTDRLKDCGVAAVDTALHAKDTRKDVAPGKDATYRIGLSGGTKPYTASFSKAPAEGLTIRNPVTYDEYIELVATKSLTQADSYTLDISDSSSAKKEVTVSIVVGVAAGGASNGATPPAGTPKETLVNAIKALSGWKVDTTTLTVDKDRTRVDDKGDVVVTVQCDAAPPAPFAEDKVRTAFYATHGEVPAVKDAKTLDQIQPRFRSEDKKCVADAAAQSRRVPRARTVPLDSIDLAQLAVIQKSLCIPQKDIDGLWGPQTATALAQWRALQAPTAVGTGRALTPREYTALYSPDAREVAERCKQ